MRVVSFVLASLAVVSLLTGCGGSSATNSQAKKVVVRHMSGMTIMGETTITDQETIAQILGFFGDLEDEYVTRISGKWKTRYRLSFVMKSGMQITVETSEDDTTWNSGSGDKQMATGISAILDPLFASSTESSDSSGEEAVVADE